MRNRFFMAVMTFVVVVSLFAVSSIGEADAADSNEDVTEYYFYGDHPIFRYYSVIADGVTITWEVTGTNGDPLIPENRGDNNEYIQVDVSNQGDGPVTVEQVVSRGDIRDSSTVLAYPLHIGDGTYTVTFMDGGNVFDTQIISRMTVVEKGSNHVVIPSGPVKDGYTFDGWFTDQTYTTEFDPTKPIRGDTTVYAKWIGTGSGSGSGGTIVIDNTHVVTFDTVTGLEYDVTDVGATRVSFTVGIVGGYQLKDGTLSVTSDHGRIVFNNGVYTLMNVNTDILVTINGELEMLPVDTPDNVDNCDFPWWIILLIALIAVIIVIVIWWRYRNKDEGEEAVESIGAIMLDTTPDKSTSDGIREAGPDDNVVDDLFRKRE